eukprot:ANDGO_05182.mRNA.1 hypothetical protein PPTG_05471
MTVLTVDIPDPVLVPGRVLQGVVRLTVTGYDLESIKSVNIKLVGLESVTLRSEPGTALFAEIERRHNSTSPGGGHHHSGHHSTVVGLTMNHSVSGEHHVYESSQVIAGEGRYPPGEHYFPFSIVIPEHGIPPTMDLISAPRVTAIARAANVSYKVKAWIPRGMFHTDYKDEKQVFMLGSDSPGLNIPDFASPIQQQDSKKFMFSSGSLRMCLQMPSRALPKGFNIEGQVVVDNQSSNHVKTIRIKLDRTIRLSAQNYTQHVGDQVINIQSPAVLAHESRPVPFSFILPVEAPSSFHGKLIHVDYKIHAECVVDATFAFNLSVSSPVNVFTMAPSSSVGQPGGLSPQPSVPFPFSQSSSFNGGMPPQSPSPGCMSAPVMSAPVMSAPVMSAPVMSAPVSSVIVQPDPSIYGCIYDFAIVNVSEGEKAPQGYETITRTIGNKPADLNTGSGKFFHRPAKLYLAFTRYPPSPGLAPISEVSLFMPNEGDVFPQLSPPWVAVSKTAGGRSANVNSGNGGTDIYLVYRRDPAKTPITDVQVVFLSDPDEENNIPPGYERVLRTVGDATRADLNRTAGGKDIYMLIRRQAAPPASPPTSKEEFSYGASVSVSSEFPQYPSTAPESSSPIVQPMNAPSAPEIPPGYAQQTPLVYGSQTQASPNAYNS